VTHEKTVGFIFECQPILVCTDEHRTKTMEFVNKFPFKTETIINIYTLITDEMRGELTRRMFFSFFIPIKHILPDAYEVIEIESLMGKICLEIVEIGLKPELIDENLFKKIQDAIDYENC
jgi:hypothetical protein